mgnify:CR=1 FL=1
MTDEPLDWTLRVSVDGAQRLLHAWKDGRLEKTLGFPIESLQIHTPFTPTPGGGGSAPPDDDSRPITLLPWDGLSVAGMVVVQASEGGPAGPNGGEPGGGSAARARAPDPAIEDVGPSAAPQGRRGRGARRVALALALLAAGLIALWLDRSSPDEPTPETSPPPATSPSAAEGLPSSAAADDSHPSAVGSESSAAWEEPAATDLADPVPDAALPQTTEPAAPLPQAPVAPPDPDATLGPAGGVASDGKVGPGETCYIVAAIRTLQDFSRLLSLGLFSGVMSVQLGGPVDDLKLAQAVKSAKLGLRMVNGARLVATSRTQTASQIWNGWCRVTVDGLRDTWGAAPHWRWYVPGRLEVFGKHTDYGGGEVLVAAAPRGFAIVAAPRDDGRLRVVDVPNRVTLELDADDAGPPRTGWTGRAGSRTSRSMQASRNTCGRG